MKRSAHTKARSTALTWPELASFKAAAAFFVLFFLYIWLRVEPAVE
jgi:hypothetical protein